MPSLLELDWSDRSRCVPKKITYNLATVAETLEQSRDYFFDTPKDIPLDFAKFKERRDASIHGLNGIYERNWDREGIDLVHGSAKFTAPKEVEVLAHDGSKARYTAPHILIATGGYPIVPHTPGSQHGITSDGFFDLDVLPPKVAVVGAGYIAIELAGIFHSLGVETHLFIRGDTFLRKFDPMIQSTLTKRYEDVGIHLHKHFPGFKSVELLRDGKGVDKLLKIVDEEGKTFEFNELLWAVGRAPQVGELDLPKAGIKQGPYGYIIVDEYQNTSTEGVYAIGDVTGQAELTPGESIFFFSSFASFKTILLPPQLLNSYRALM